MPSGAAARVVCLVDDAANFFERPNMFGVSPKRELDFGLFEHGIDAAQPVRPRVRHRVEAAERIVEIGQRLAVGPAALRLFRSQ